MLKDITQADTRLITPIRKYGCYFLCIAHASKTVFKGAEGCQRLNGIWTKAIELGYISGDINHDGDLDDDGEAEIKCPDKIAREFFNLDVRYDNTHHDAVEAIPANVKVVIGQYWYQSSHFVLINKSKKVIYDPYGKSNTVSKGYLKSQRWFYAI